ncbi:hypothetical protein [Arenibacter sp. F20364]|jgi:hypothetical protein|uniref:hypothetical protein n=1 Tax=Arenibacter sp. F20364 TaxID=2926415 RepID=UPI001FF0F1D8|nr:hypothetical protein [Arenibacter sp. F20364]MCK0192024.1 hypothetical protein [Arenibacter sp. F20364]|tara:strand:- start:51054 stop:51542 length:489 start_codon:yes stop_codon:yes gene_type:complete
MNDVHIHLALNHLPTVGVLIGFLVLLFGLIIKNPQVKNTALGIFIFSALTAIAVFYTGYGAEEIVENLPGISETLIHEHEEYAELFFTMMLILGSSSLITLILQYKEYGFGRYAFGCVLLLSIGSMVISNYAGTTGEEITHIEIGSDTSLIQIDSNNDSTDN